MPMFRKMGHRKTGGMTCRSHGKQPFWSCPLTPGVLEFALTMRYIVRGVRPHPGKNGHHLYRSGSASI